VVQGTTRSICESLVTTSNPVRAAGGKARKKDVRESFSVKERNEGGAKKGPKPTGKNGKMVWGTRWKKKKKSGNPRLTRYEM